MDVFLEAYKYIKLTFWKMFYLGLCQVMDYYLDKILQDGNVDC